ncbi:hypothetical protein Ancab_032109 [Ancistrocladus abbreviatus]
MSGAQWCSNRGWLRRSLDSPANQWLEQIGNKQIGSGQTSGKSSGKFKSGVGYTYDGISLAFQSVAGGRRWRREKIWAAELYICNFSPMRVFVTVKEMTEKRGFESVPQAFRRYLVALSKEEAQSSQLDDAADQKNIAKFSQVWNEFIHSLQLEDLISQRDKDLLLVPYTLSRVSVAQWPPFPLASKDFKLVVLRVTPKLLSDVIIIIIDLEMAQERCDIIGHPKEVILPSVAKSHAQTLDQLGSILGNPSHANYHSSTSGPIAKPSALGGPSL